MSKILAIIIIALIATIGIYYFLISEKNRAVNLNLEMLDVKISGISIIGEKVSDSWKCRPINIL